MSYVLNTNTSGVATAAKMADYPYQAPSPITTGTLSTAAPRAPEQQKLGSASQSTVSLPGK